eukprot:12939837-Alexandrium_andersonii.AAC.1
MPQNVPLGNCGDRFWVRPRALAVQAPNARSGFAWSAIHAPSACYLDSVTSCSSGWTASGDQHWAPA